MSADASSVLASLRGIFGRVLGTDPTSLRSSDTFLSLGAESLALLQASTTIAHEFGVTVPFRRLMGDLGTLDALCTHIAGERTQAASRPTAPPRATMAARGAQASAPATRPRPESSTLSLERLLQGQLTLMEEQLALLRARGATTVAEEGAAIEAAPSHDTSHASPGDTSPVDPRVALRPSRARETTLSTRQRAYIDGVIERVGRRTRRSKEAAQHARRGLADSRASARFKPLLKELCYQVSAARAAGAHFWDLDGNEYVDIAMGFGSLLFGHSPGFLVDALETAFKRGLRIGPQEATGAAAAELVRSLTGVERVAFCNSGTEAVMSALRVARAATGRRRVALFLGSYHGSFDGVLATRVVTGDGTARVVPVAPGVTPGMVEDVLLLPYGEASSVEAVHAAGADLAAVLVEPRQSRRPDLAADDFIRDLRKATSEQGTVLIFDEVITGFRVHPGGAQRLIGVSADLVTYGKAAGGGLPVGIVAGKASLLDYLDGGYWRFGDDSMPPSDMTVFMGTFFKHPLIMAGTHAVLTHLNERGPELQRALNESTTRLGGLLNDVFDRAGAPVHVGSFGSLFCFSFGVEAREIERDLFFAGLLERGVYVWEGRTCYLSTAHDESDIHRIAAAVEETVAQMQAGGFLERASSGGPAVAARPASTPAAIDAEVPLTPIQSWFFEQELGDPSGHVQYAAVRLDAGLEPETVARALAAVVSHHAAFGLRVAPGSDRRWRARIGSPHPGTVTLEEHARPAGSDADFAAAARRLQRVIDVESGPLVAAALITDAAARHLLVAVHHLIVDAFSWRILMDDFVNACDACARGRQPAFQPATTPYADWAVRLGRQRGSAALRRELDAWLRSPVVPTALTTDSDGRNTESSRAVVTGALDRTETLAFVERARALDVQPAELVLSGIACALARAIDAPVVDIMLETHGRDHGFRDVDLSRTVGWFTRLVPLQLPVDPAGQPAQLVRSVAARCRERAAASLAYDIVRYGGGIDRIAAALRAQPHPQVSFNFFGAAGARAAESAPSDAVRAMGTLRPAEAIRPFLVETDARLTHDVLEINWHYSSAVHRRTTIERLKDLTLETLHGWVQVQDATGHAHTVTAAG